VPIFGPSCTLNCALSLSLFYYYYYLFLQEAICSRQRYMFSSSRHDVFRGHSIYLLLLSHAGSPSKVSQPLDHVIICRVKSGQTAAQLRQQRETSSGSRPQELHRSESDSAISFWPPCNMATIRQLSMKVRACRSTRYIGTPITAACYRSAVISQASTMY